MSIDDHCHCLLKKHAGNYHITLDHKMGHRKKVKLAKKADKTIISMDRENC